MRAESISIIEGPEVRRPAALRPAARLQPAAAALLACPAGTANRTSCLLCMRLDLLCADVHHGDVLLLALPAGTGAQPKITGPSGYRKLELEGPAGPTPPAAILFLASYGMA